MKAFNVYLRGKLIDTVFYNDRCDGGSPITADMVKDSLINHDGYNPYIDVSVRRLVIKRHTSQKPRQPIKEFLRDISS